MKVKDCEMDKIDQKLIAALRRDGRASLSELSALVGLSRTAVRARLSRLEDEGEILGFTVVLKNDAREAPVRGLMMLAIEGQGSDRIRRQLLGIPEVQAVHATNGRWDMIAEIGTEDLEALDAVLARIRRIPGVIRSETSLLLATRRASRL